jgi:hypothetical protein
MSRQEYRDCFDYETKNERQLYEQDDQERNTFSKEREAKNLNDICKICGKPYKTWFYCCEVDVIGIFEETKKEGK